MPPTIKAVLFDKDGTLVDFRATWVAAYRGVARELAARAGGGRELADHLLRRAGYDPDTDRFEEDSPLLWATGEAVAAIWRAEPVLREVAGIEAVVAAHFGDHRRYPPVPIGDLHGLMTRLRHRRLRLGIATMDTTEKARATVLDLGIAEHFAFVVGADAGHGAKPGPGMVHAFCDVVGCTPEETVVVGDSRADLAMARNAGCAVAVAVRTGGTPPRLLAPLADAIIGDVQELDGLLDRLTT